ncbi:MAG: enoyl-CoA hydratase/isomerase family protein [Actinomycetota bacterium]
MRTDFEHLLIERRGPVLLVTLNRPDKLNALHAPMHEEVLELLRTVDGDPDSNVVVLTGAGRGFCAGGDVTKMPGADGEPQVRESELYLVSRPLTSAILAVEKPIVAMVNGPASGLGATIALFCDVVVASDAAHFSDSHVNVGLVAGDGGAVIWPLLVGVARAKEYLLTGQRLTAAEAERIGLVNHVVAADSLEEFTLELAGKIAAQPAFAVRATKATINRHLRRSFEDTMDVGGAWQLISLKSDEHKAAVKAFAERKKKS